MPSQNTADANIISEAQCSFMEDRDCQNPDNDKSLFVIGLWLFVFVQMIDKELWLLWYVVIT